MPKETKSTETEDLKFKKVVQTFLRSPPKPHKKAGDCLDAGDYFLVVDGQMRVAHIRSKNEDGSTTVDLFRNLDDYREDRAMERDFVYWS